jgi:phosphoribosylformylglycinamidine synthase
VKAAVLYIEGTNCEDDAVKAFQAVGAKAEKVHLKQLTKECASFRHRNLKDYDILFLPGGWSAGDYVRAGAIYAARMRSKLDSELNDFIDSEKRIVGVCNGFQILVEAGILPGFDGVSEHPEAVLAINAEGRFQCRPTYIKHMNKSQITDGLDIDCLLQIPIAHAEGRLTFGQNTKESLSRLEKQGQIAFKYCRKDGSPADGVFPWNPNGSVADIAGISNPKGNVLGMMPHPERVIYPYQQADWSRSKYDKGDGFDFFKSLIRL